MSMQINVPMSAALGAATGLGFVPSFSYVPSFRSRSYGTSNGAYIADAVRPWWLLLALPVVALIVFGVRLWVKR